MNCKFLIMFLVLGISRINALTISYDYKYPRYLDYYHYDYYYPNWQGYFVKPRPENKIWKNYRIRNKARCKYYCPCCCDYNCGNPVKEKLNYEAINR